MVIASRRQTRCYYHAPHAPRPPARSRATPPSPAPPCPPTHPPSHHLLTQPCAAAPLRARHTRHPRPTRAKLRERMGGLQLWERRGVAIGTPPSRSVLQSSTGRADGCLTQSGFAMSTKRPSDGGGALTPRQRRSRRSSSSMTQARELAGSREYTASASRCKSH